MCSTTSMGLSIKNSVSHVVVFFYRKLFIKKKSFNCIIKRVFDFLLFFPRKIVMCNFFYCCSVLPAKK